jgi:hypothetical protein
MSWFYEIRRAGAPSLMIFKGGAFDLLLMDWIKAWDQCALNRFLSSRRTKNFFRADLLHETRDRAH